MDRLSVAFRSRSASAGTSKPRRGTCLSRGDVHTGTWWWWVEFEVELEVEGRLMVAVEGLIESEEEEVVEGRW